MARQEPSQRGYLSPSEEESGTEDLTAGTGSEGAIGPSLCPGSHVWHVETHKQTQEVQGLGCAWEPCPAQAKTSHFPALTPPFHGRDGTAQLSTSSALSQDKLKSPRWESATNPPEMRGKTFNANRPAQAGQEVAAGKRPHRSVNTVLSLD